MIIFYICNYIKCDTICNTRNKGDQMISVRLDNSMEDQLNFLSKEKHISKSQIIKDSLFYYFDMLKKDTEQKTSYELGSELFGKYSSGDENLSTTYKQKLKEKIKRKNDE